MREKIKCQICGREFKTITNTHLKQHGLTTEIYKSMYGEDSLYSEEALDRKSKASKKMHADPVHKIIMDKRVYKNKEIQERRSRKLKVTFSSPEKRKEMSEAMKKVWEDDEKREKITKAIQESRTEEFKERQSEAMKEFYKENPEVIEKQIESRKVLFDNPEFMGKWRKIREEAGANISKGLKEYYKDNLEAREKLSREMKEREVYKHTLNDEVKEKRSKTMKETLGKPEVKKRRSKGQKRRWENMLEREKYSEMMTRKILAGEFNPKSHIYKTGYYYSEKMDKEFYFRSSYEERCFGLLDAIAEVEVWFYEPFGIPYKDEEGRKRYYIPDVYVLLDTGEEFVLEIKAEWELSVEEVSKKIGVGRSYCGVNGLGYEVLVECDLELGGLRDKLGLS